MAIELRKTGISVVGDVPWGTHFCHFYETKQDLLDTLVPYFKAGLENNEFCLWVLSDTDLITVAEAKEALAQTVPDLDRHLSDENIEILKVEDWYFEQEAMSLERAKDGWDDKLKRSLARGYEGLRASADTFWLAERDWKDFFAYEKQVNEWITNQSMTVMCTYPLAKSGATEVLNVVQAHQFAIARRQGEWEVIETPELIQAKAEIRRLNEELEQRVLERTGQLARVIQELTDEISDRKQSEVELSLAHQRLSYHVENTPLAVIEWDNDRFIKRWSKRAEEVFGWKTSEALGKNLYDPDFPIVYEEDAQAVEEIDGQLTEGTIHRNLSLNRNYTKDGKVIYCEWYNSILRDEDGNVITILSLVHDVTERKHVEHELRRQKEILQQIFDHIPVMINFVEADGRIKLVNREWERMLGWSLEEIGQQNLDIFAECYPDPQYRQEVLKFIAEAQGEWADFKTRVRDGRVMDTTFLRILLSDGTSIGIGQDITERKQAEEKLKQSENQLTEAQRLAHVGSFDWDLRTNAVTWSDELYRIFGVQPGGIMVNGDAMSFIHPEDRDWVWRTVQSSVENKKPYSLYYRVLRPDGDERIVHTQGRVVSDEDGPPIRVFGATQDVTELKRAEEQLKVATEQLRALSAGLESAREEEGTRIARELHDELGSALTSLRWSLDEIDSNLSTSAGKSEASLTRRRIAAMTSLVEGTLNTVRRISSELRPSMLDDLGLAAAIEWQAQQFQERTGISCSCDCSVENAELNREQSTAVFRILQEALTNVLRHAQATGVDIKIEKQDGYFAMSVRDNGKGNTEREKLGILGMRERAHLIGAEIEIKGTRGKGTVVIVRVPIPGEDRI